MGLDVGSTTVKAVTVKQGAITFRGYRRHRGKVWEEAQTLLAQARESDAARVVVTGSAGASMAERLGAQFVHEVHAVAAEARAMVPGVRTVIELGGQDAKMVHLDAQGGLITEMNERCAAGTGVVIDRCAYRLGLSEGLVQLLLGDELLPVVSARCGVFAEADLVALVKAGVSAQVAMLALLEGIVRQNLVSLARGRTLAGPVCLLGGPNAFIPALPRVWRRHLEARWKEREAEPSQVVVPEDAALFAARGALRSLGRADRIGTARPRRKHLAAGQASLVVNPSSSSTRVHGAGARVETVPRPVASPHPGRLSLGLDAGSTTVKAVALTEEGAVVASAYRRAAGNVFEDARAVLEELSRALGPRVAEVGSLGVTGYAAELLGPLLSADCTVVETLAHARSALHFVPEAQVVCDVGGQDIKVLQLNGPLVSDFKLSHQCAAGNGALLEATAHSLGIGLDEVAEVTSKAQRVPRFGIGCAVFLDTERITAQRDGMQPSEILAGITAALPRIIWENVVAQASLPQLGDVFVLSGGVQRNQAAVQAQAEYLAQRHPQARIVVHPFPGEAGAIGAGLAGRAAVESGQGSTRFIGLEAASRLSCSARSDESTRCRQCPSHCSRAVLTAQRDTERRSLVTGNACERGAVHEPALREGPPRSRRPRAKNLVRTEANRLFRRPQGVKVVSDLGRHLRLALPRVLAQYRAAPLLMHYFAALGVPPEQLVTGEFTSEALWRRFAGRGTTDACFPAKVVQAHIAALLAHREAAPFDVLFFPLVTHAATGVKGCADTAACPVVAGTPLVTKTAFQADGDGLLPNGVRLLTPTLVLNKRKELSPALYDSVASLLPTLSREVHEAALTEGLSGQRRCEHLLEQLGAAAIRDSAQDKRCAIVLLGRPYHADPGLHHELSSELTSLGRTTLTLRSLPHSPEMLASIGCSSTYELTDLPFLTNSGDGERLAAARLVGQHPFLVAIELSSFKCGQDVALYSRVAQAARGLEEKPFLALHDLDETRPVASLRLRVRTFLDGVERWEAKAAQRQWE